MKPKLNERIWVHLRSALSPHIRRMIFHNRPPGDVIDRLRIQAWLILSRLGEFVQEDPDKLMRKAERAVFFAYRQAMNTVPEGFEVRDGRNTLHEPILTGMWAPEVSRHTQVEVSADMTTVCQHLSSTPLKLELRVLEAFLKSKEYLTNPELQTRMKILEEEAHRIGNEPFWIAARILDFRFRIYADTRGGWSYQGDKLQMSCLRFGEALAVPNPEILWWFLNHHGVTSENYRGFIKTPVKTVDNHGPHTLSAAYAAEEFVRTGCSSYMCELDQTNSGGGYISLLMGDRSLATLCNLLGKGGHDLYRLMGEQCRMLDTDLLHTDLEIIRKEIAKPVAVPGQYSAGPARIAKGLLGFDDEEFSPENFTAMLAKMTIPGCLTKSFKGMDSFEEIHSKMQKKARLYLRALHSVAPSIRGYIDACTKLRAMHDGDRYNLTHISGMPVTLLPWRRLQFKSVRIGSKIEGLGELKASTSPIEYYPNGDTSSHEVHKSDSGALYLTGLQAHEDNIPVLTKHDAVLLHAANIPWLYPVITKNVKIIGESMDFRSRCEAAGIQLRKGNFTAKDIKPNQAKKFFTV